MAISAGAPHNEMTCDRCGVDAELGRCGGCGRELCVTCYDGDQNGYCHPAPIVQRDEAIRALHGSMSVEEIAGYFNLSPRQVWRVTSG